VRCSNALAAAHTPRLDRAVPLLSRSANHSVLWVVFAIGLAASGQRRGMRAAVRSLGSVAVTSLVINQGVKRVVRRPRPSLRKVPAVRRVAVGPLTTSFPSERDIERSGFDDGLDERRHLSRPASETGSEAFAVREHL
jgi:undecaprenyl-diphosphatase